MVYAMKLSTIQRDRAIGAIIGSAAGDALGAPYEFKPPVSPETPIELKGGGSFNWAPGEWTDDTSMAIPILQLIAAGKDLADESTKDELVAAWKDWAKSAPDVGLQTRHVLGSLRGATSTEVLEISRELHERTGRTAGNGSLMRTGPVGIANLDSAEQTAANARALSELTHWDETAGDACVLWCLAIRHAVINGKLDIRVGLNHLPAERLGFWQNLIEEAEANEPAYFSNNGWVIHAFQAAWSAIYRAANADAGNFKFDAERFAYSLELAVRTGYDTDTVAAIAGSLAGAFWGFTAVPAKWRLKLHGWPLFTELDLVRLTNIALNGEGLEAKVWPNVDHFNYSNFYDRFELVQHPKDPGLWVGGVATLSNLPEVVTAVVSLCRVGKKDVPLNIEESLEVMLLDQAGPDSNLNLGFVFTDVADAIKQLRDEGHVVFLHCVQSQSRTPSVALTYSMRHLGQTLDEATEDLRRVLPNGTPIRYFVEQLKELDNA